MKRIFTSIIPHTLRILFTIVILCSVPSLRVSANELTPVTQKEGTSITVNSKDGSAIGAVYVKWNNPVSPYRLLTDTQELSCGEQGFLHEFILLPEPSSTVTFSLPEDSSMGIYSIRIFTDENVPEDVQIWEPPCERPDILLISAHADDEILFMGGIIPTYVSQGARVQVAYMTEFWTTTPVREHEKLDGLWTDGLRTYPVCADIKDTYVETLEAAEKVYDREAMSDYVVDLIDRLQPQIVVTHDFNGEYGHAFHKLTASAVADALGRASFDVPKAYFHLYPENSIHMDLNSPIESMGGKTALEIAKEAYLQHKSQQWCWFYVSDTYKYSCADFGLYKTTVGVDENASMLDHIVLYSEQERLAEEARLEQERLEKERLEKEAAEKEKLALIDKELSSLRDEAQDKADQAAAELESLNAELAAERSKATTRIIVCVVLLVLIPMFYLLFTRRSGRADTD